MAAKLGWSCRSTDKLARHAGRPWVGAYGKDIPEHVAEHYRELSVEGLFLDVLSHYEKNVLPLLRLLFILMPLIYQRNALYLRDLRYGQDL